MGRAVIIYLDLLRFHIRRLISPVAPHGYTQGAVMLEIRVLDYHAVQIVVDEEDNTQPFSAGLIQGQTEIMASFRVHIGKRFIKKPYGLFII